ncbi:MAG: hypothetical protein LBV27_07500 [Oscillospiraceae bacterium]|jgi:hypothetical protein|nr:hypothetical protein [Oscillospiraceae bacterium]
MKKILALVLAVMLVVGMTPAAFAADYDPGVVGLGYSSGPAVTPSGDIGEINPGVAKLILKLFDSTGVHQITEREWKDGKLSIQTQQSGGTKAIKGIKVKYDSAKNAYIEVEFADSYVATGEQEFKFTIYVLKDKSRIEDSKFEFEGKIKNKEQKIDTSYDFVYTYDVPVVEADEYLKAIKVDAGNDVIISAKMFAGKKYYARATVKVKSEDDAILTEYPDIDTIYYLDTVNMSGSGNTVKLDIGDKLFVYNKDLEYIGTTSDDLPFSSKYYVSSKELDVEDAGDIETPEGPSEAENPEMGGDDVPQNINDNPGTGR